MSGAPQQFSSLNYKQNQEKIQRNELVKEKLKVNNLFYVLFSKQIKLTTCFEFVIRKQAFAKKVVKIVWPIYSNSWNTVYIISVF